MVPFAAEMKETSKENAAATPATIQRRRRPKRRSTGVVQIDMEVFFVLTGPGFTSTTTTTQHNSPLGSTPPPPPPLLLLSSTF